MKIKLAELVGEQCLSMDDGDKLYRGVLPELKRGASVTLDFTGVTMLLTPFLKSGIGKLLTLFAKETLMQKLVFAHTTAGQLKTLNEFIDESDRAGTRRAGRETLEDLFREDAVDEDSASF